MKRYRQSKADANQTQIFRAWRKAGYSVLDLSSVGRGCPDALIARNGQMALVEIKDGEKCPSHRKLTDHQLLFILRWKGPKVQVVTRVDEALKVIE